MWRCVNPATSRQMLVRDFPNVNPVTLLAVGGGETTGQRRSQNVHQMTGNKAGGAGARRNKVRAGLRKM